MAELQEKQFELNGALFGLGAPVELTDGGWVPGSAPLRVADADQPSGDGVRMGKDYKGAPVWAFSMYTNGETEDDAWDRLGALAARWDDDAVRLDSGAVVPLRYRVAGKSRCVFGRPRRWTATPDNASMQGRINIEADFTLADPTIYDDVLQTETIAIGVPLELDAGFVAPFIAPFISSAGASVRESVITVGGNAPTPITVTFRGPVSGASARIGGWTAALRDPVTSGDPVTIDGRPWVRAATKQSGGGARVSPRVTRISRMWLPPGKHEVVFTGEDPTSTASVLVSWRDAYRTPR